MQGGTDWLADNAQSSKLTHNLKIEAEKAGLSAGQAAAAKALFTLKNLGPVEASLIAKKFGSIGGIVRHFLCVAEPQASREIAELQKANGRRVGPSAAAKLKRLLLSRDASEEYVEKDTAPRK